MASWDASRVKSHIRFTAQKLSLLQENHDSSALVLQNDIADLLEEGNVYLARVKAEQLWLDDARSDLLGKLEMLCDVMLGSFKDLKEGPPARDSPIFESVCTLIYAAPLTGIRELLALRDILLHRVGVEFLRFVSDNALNCVPLDVHKRLNLTSVQSDELDQFLHQIAQSRSVNWIAPMSRSQRLSALIALTDAGSEIRMIDLDHLRELCSRGVPPGPSWLRPRIWRLFFKLLSTNKDSWKSEITEKRETYNVLAQRLVLEFDSLGDPTVPLGPQDSSLMESYKSLSGLPSSMKPQVGISQRLSTDTKIGEAAGWKESFESRVRQLLGTAEFEPWANLSESTEKSTSHNLQIKITSPSNDSTMEPIDDSTLSATTSGVDTQYFWSILRILYLHKATRPATLPYVTPLCVIIYNCLSASDEQLSIYDVEVDTFWLLGELVGEMSDLSDEEGVNTWMCALRERLQELDGDLCLYLTRLGLDPSLPHFSYRWISPLLAYTLPFDSLLTVWDGIFAQPSESNMRLKFLLDVCCIMLVQVKADLMLKPAHSTDVSLSRSGDTPRSPLSPLNPAWTRLDPALAFADALALLQHYPIERVGGAGKILQLAIELPLALKPPTAPTSSISNLTGNFWRGLTHRATASLSSNDEVHPEAPSIPKENSIVPSPTRPTLSDRLRQSVARGISNESAMDVPPSPDPPITPSATSATQTFVDGRSEDRNSKHTRGSSIWEYTSTLRDSNTAATLSRLGSNLKAKAIVGWVSPKSETINPVHPIGNSPSTPASERSRGRDALIEDPYEPPERPAIFLPPRDTPRDSFSPQSDRPINYVQSPESTLPPHGGTWPNTPVSPNVANSIKGLTRKLPSPTQRGSGPKPLLLDASNLITPSTTISRSASSSPILDMGQWSDVYRDVTRATNRLRDSQSSASTFSARQSLDGRRAADSDGESRVVPLRRGTAAKARDKTGWIENTRGSNRSSTIGPAGPNSFRDSSGSEYMSDGGILTHRVRDKASSKGWGQVQLPDSPPASVSSPPLTTPRSSLLRDVRTVTLDEIGQYARDGTFNGVSHDGHQDHRLSLQDDTLTARKHIDRDETAFSAVLPEPARSPKVRSKRYGTKPSKLQLSDAQKPSLALPYDAEFDLASSTPRADDAFALQQQTPNARALQIPRRLANQRPESGAEDGDDEAGYDDILSGY